MFFPALLAKFLSAGAIAQAATGAGVALVVATGAGATGVLGADVQDTVTSVVGVNSEESGQGEPVVVEKEPTIPTPTDVTTPAETTATVETTGAVDVEAWVNIGPDGYSSFSAWVTAGAHDPHLKDMLRAQGSNFGSEVSRWAHNKGVDIDDIEGIEDADGTASVTPSPTTTVHDEVEDADDDHGGNRGHGNGGGNSGSAGHGNGRGHN